ncbi:MAG: thioredoxin-related protein [Psychroserpens sp.]|jgi:thioredoxin-related protein|uniref:thioredoxin family protein n=1 Tax=Psychroserpens sp. TaxID=2020870 RepID=UPI0039E4FEE4
MKHIFLSLVFSCFVMVSYSQSDKAIEWKTWAQLEHALNEQPKPVLIYFHADWCAYCKKLDREVFTNTEVVERINRDYYAVEMDVESLDTIVFDGMTFVNTQAKTKRNAVHELPLLLASRKHEAFSLPVTLFFDINFVVRDRTYYYYTAKQLLKAL